MFTKVHTFKRSCQVQCLAVPIADAMSAASKTHMNVYVLRYSTEWSDADMVQVYDSLQGVMNRLAISQFHNNFDEGEKFTIECMEVTTEAKSLESLNNIRQYYENKKRKDTDNKEENN